MCIRDRGIGAQDEFSRTRLAGSVLIGGAAGGALGGLFGGVGGAFFRRNLARGADGKLDFSQKYIDKNKDVQEALKAQQTNNLNEAIDSFEKAPSPENDNVIGNLIDQEIKPQVERIHEGLLDELAKSDRTTYDKLVSGNIPNVNKNQTRNLDEFLNADNFPDMDPAKMQELKKVRAVLDNLNQTRTGMERATALEVEAQRLEDTIGSQKTPEDIQAQQSQANKNRQEAASIRAQIGNFLKTYQSADDNGMIEKLLSLNNINTRLDAEGNLTVNKSQAVDGNETPNQAEKEILGDEPDEVNPTEPEVKTETAEEITDSLNQLRKEKIKTKRQKEYRAKLQKQGKELSEEQQTKAKSYEDDIKELDVKIKDAEGKLTKLENEKIVKTDDAINAEQQKQAEEVLQADKARKEGRAQEADDILNEQDVDPDKPKADLKPEPITVSDRMNQAEELLASDPQFNPNRPDVINTDKGAIRFIYDMFDPADMKAEAAKFRKEVSDLVKNQKYERKQARLIALQNRIDDYVGDIGVQHIADMILDPEDAFSLRGIYNRDTFMGILNGDPRISEESKSLIINSYERAINDETNALRLLQVTNFDMPNSPLEHVLETIQQFYPEAIPALTRALYNETGSVKKIQKSPDVKTILSGIDLADFTDLEKVAIEKAAAVFANGMNKPGREFNTEAIRKIIQMKVDQVRARRQLGDKVFDVKPQKDAGGKTSVTVSTSVSLGKDRNGKIQNLLRKANRYGLTDGPLLEKYKKNGEVYTGTAAAEEALLQAKIDSKNDTGSTPDLEKFAYIDANTGIKTRKRTTVVDGKRVENQPYGMYVKEVLAINEAISKLVRSIQGLKRGDSKYITGNELEQLNSELQREAGVTWLGGSGGLPLRTINITKDKVLKEFPGNSDGTNFWVYSLVTDDKVIDKVKKSQSEVFENKYEQISGNVYERKAVAEGSTGAADDVTGRIYASTEDLPSDNIKKVTATYDEIRKDLMSLRKRFTNSTQQEKASNEVLIYKTGKNYNVAILQRDLREINARIRELNNAENTSVNELAKKTALQQKALLKKKIRELGGDPKGGRLNKKALANYKKAHMAGVAEDEAAAKQSIEDYTGKKIDAEDEEISTEILDQDLNAESIQAKMKDELTEIALDFNSGNISKEDYDLAVRSIMSRLIDMGKESPTTKPVGRNKPDVIDFKGYEVDVNNHFQIKNIDNVADAQNVFFLGKRIGRIMKRGDILEVHSNELDGIQRYESSDFLKRNLPVMFEAQVLSAGRKGKLATSNLSGPDSTKHFRRKDHTKTNTYEGAVEEPETNPTKDGVDNATDVEKYDDPRLDTYLSQFLPKIPKGRSLSIYLATGEYANTVRTPSQKQLDGSSIQDVLKRQSKQEFIIGHVDSSAKGPLDKLNSFEPLQNIGQAYRKLDKTPSKKSSIDDSISTEPGPVGLQRASKIALDKKLIPDDPDFRANHSTVGDVLRSIEVLEGTPWAKLTSKDDVQRVMRQLDLLNGIVERHVPRGVKLPNRSRETSFQKLSTIMTAGNVNQADINAVLMTMSRMAGSEMDAASPNFGIIKSSDSAGAYFGTGTQESGMQNLIGIDLTNITKNGVPPGITIMHELGHWAYANVLDASQKKHFWNTMAKYVVDEGVDFDALKRRLPGDPSIGNELSSPSEFFAQQFVQYAIAQNKAGGKADVISMWKRMGKVINEVIQRWFGMGKGADGSKAVDMAAIDPDLIPLFQRIFPDRDPVNRYADLASKFKNADNRTKYRLSVLMDLDDVRMKIDKALNGSHEEMLAALGGRGMESDRPSVATVLNSYLRNASGPNKQKKRFGNPTKNRRIRSADRKQFFEEGELVDIEGSVPRHRNQSDYHTFMKITDSYWKVINHAKKMRDPRFTGKGEYEIATAGQYLGALEETAGKGKKGAIDVANAREIMKLHREQLLDDAGFSDTPGMSTRSLDDYEVDISGGNVSPTALIAENAMANATPDNIDQVAITRALAFDVLGSLESAEKRLRRQLHNIFGEMDGFDITTQAGGDGTVSLKGSKNKTTKRFRTLNAKRKNDNVKNQLTKQVKEIEKLEKQADKILKQGLKKEGKDQLITKSPKQMSVREIADESLGTKKQSARTMDLSAELVQKLLSEPEVPEFGQIQKAIEADPSLAMLSNGRPANTPAEFVQLLQEGFNQGYQARMDYAMYVLRNQPDGLNLIPKDPTVKRMVIREAQQNKGVSGENGIPAKTPVYIKEFLRKITHRDPIVENNARTFTYRLLNVLGKTQFDKAQTNNFLTMDDVGIFFPETYFGANYGTFEHVNHGETLNVVRKAARKIATSLKKGKTKIDYTDPNVDRNPVGRDRTIVDEAAYMLYHGGFDEDNKLNVINAYKEALENGEARAVKISEADAARAQDGRFDRTTMAAAKWFIDGFDSLITQKTNKKALYAGLSNQADMEANVDKLTEHVAYTFNKLMGNKTLRQRYRYLTYFGDMHYDAASAHPIKKSVDQTGNSGTLHLAKKYAQETIDSFDDATEAAHREFLAARPHDNLIDYVYYHGTPNGDAFNKYIGGGTPKASSADSLFGPGLYLAKDPTASETYARFTHKNSLKAMVDSDDPDIIAVTDEIIDDIMENNYKLNDISREYAGREIRNSTASRITEIENGVVEGIDGDPAYRMVQDSQAYERLMLKNEELFERLSQFTSVKRNPKVVPFFVKANNMFDFSENASYSMGTGQASDISFLMKELNSTGLMKENEASRLLNEFKLQGELDGADFYQNLVDSLAVGGRSDAEAKTLISRMFTKLGYDGFLITEPHPVTNEVVDAIVINSNKSVRTVDANVEDSVVNPPFAQDKVGKYQSLNGQLLQDIVELNKTLSDGDYVNIGSQAQKLGMPDAMQGFIKKTLRKEIPDIDDVKVIEKNYRTNFLSENSAHLRKIGAEWLGNIMKPKDGVGIYQMHAADLAKKVQPVMTMLQKLPDYGNGVKRYINKTAPFFKAIPLVGRAVPDSTMAPPASHKRIIRAMRAGDISRLPDAEKQIANHLVGLFKKELNDMHALGIPVGDVTLRSGTKYYVPQIWNADIVRERPKAFVEAIERFIIKEKRAEGIQPNAAEVSEIASQMMNRIIDTDGRIDVDVDARTSGISSDPFYQRFITLDKDSYPEFADYLVDDLEGVVTKYFDKTTRKMLMAKKFGAGGHGLNAYTVTSKLGVDGAADILSQNKLISMSRSTDDAVLEVSHVVIPTPTQIDRTALKNILREIQSDLQNTNANTASAKTDAARRRLLALTDTGELNQAQMTNLKIRIDAVVNGLKDFPGGMTEGSESFIRSINDVLERRPMSDNRMLNNVSKKMRAFNSVSLLGWTTLTSAPDIALPLIRSGNFRGWMKAWKDVTLGSPEYRQAAKDIGVGVENLIHDRMTHMAGDGSQQFQHAFFYGTGLQSWTNFMREVSAVVGYNTFKAEADAAQRLIAKGQMDTRAYRKSLRLLKRYGLESYGMPGARRMADIKTVAGDDQFRYATMRFVNETIFTPDPNDVPLWAQHPIGSMVFQLKSFPLMMMRMVFGEGGVTSEFGKGNFAPMIALLTVGGGMGMAANTIKDYALSRGGEDGRSRSPRDRLFSKTAVGETFKVFTGVEGEDADKWLRQNLGDEADAWLGNYLEGIVALGGMGLLAELFFNTAAQADNRYYGAARMVSAIGGPSMGVTFDAAANIGGGIEFARESVGLGDDGSNSAERAFTRTLLRRVPVLGGTKPFSEGGTDLIAGEQQGRSSKSEGADIFDVMSSKEFDKLFAKFK